MTPAERRGRGFAAKALLADPTITDAFDEIENDICREWANAGSTWGAWFSSRKRDRLWIELRTVQTLRRKLASFAGSARD